MRPKLRVSTSDADSFGWVMIQKPPACGLRSALGRAETGGVLAVAPVNESRIATLTDSAISVRVSLPAADGRTPARYSYHRLRSRSRRAGHRDA